MDEKELSPFLKWPGGKRWFIKKYLSIFPCHYERYFEPFVGSGAVFFALNPVQPILSDINKDLINVYVQMRDFPDLMVQEMLEHQKHHSKDYYYDMRAMRLDDPIKQASKFLYLNRTCFNGMYRENLTGQFNVPIGTKSNCIFDIEKFPQYSKRLRSATILNSDFREIINKTKKNDLLFVDPPYTVKKNQNGFIKYNSRLFSWEDQKDLFKCLIEARERGTIIISTNAYCNELIDIYSKEFFVTVIQKKSTISGIAEKRKACNELLITSFPVEEI